VPRLYEASRGVVLLDGRDVRDLTLESVGEAAAADLHATQIRMA
jgi:hypothetical protein